jgi:hypothetical protein
LHFEARKSPAPQESFALQESHVVCCAGFVRRAIVEWLESERQWRVFEPAPWDDELMRQLMVGWMMELKKMTQRRELAMKKVWKLMVVLALTR